MAGSSWRKHRANSWKRMGDAESTRPGRKYAVTTVMTIVNLMRRRRSGLSIISAVMRNWTSTAANASRNGINVLINRLAGTGRMMFYSSGMMLLKS